MRVRAQEKTRSTPIGPGPAEVTSAAVLAVSVVVLLHAAGRSSWERGMAADRSMASDHGATSEGWAEMPSMAGEYLVRLRMIPFGRPSDPAPAGALLTELFDDDQDFGSITLHQVAVPAGERGHTFGVARDGTVGVWRVRVSNDLDGDGAVLGAREGRDDLLAIEIHLEDRLVLSTLRANEPVFTAPDLGARYLK